MPTYEYQCEKCNATFDIFQSMKDERLTTCPREACRMEPWGQGPVKRLLGTGAGIIFKGSGFYSTDYRSSGYKESAKSESTAQAAKPSAGESSPGKPAEKPKPSESSPKPATPSSPTTSSS